MRTELIETRYGYAAARAAFRAIASAQGYALSSFRHPSAQGPGGGELVIDVARRGPARPGALLVVLSGVHGVEGLAGSLCQQALMKRPSPPGHTAILLVHAVNPYGFAHLTRSNEDNVDLNRNGLETFATLPTASAYDALHADLVPSSWSVDGRAAKAELSDLIARTPSGSFQAAVSGGQFAWPDGLFYGGCEPAWSRRVLEGIAALAFPGVARIALIDLHTGLGRFGQGELIYTGAASDPELAVTRARFAPLPVHCPDEGGSVSAPVTGPLVDVFRRAAPPGALAAVALEFGVRDLPATLNALRGAAWLRTTPSAPAHLAEAVRRDMVEAFFSPDPAWIRSVTQRFLTVADVALEALR